MLIVGGTTACSTAGNGEQSTLLYFLLVPKEAHERNGGPAFELYALGLEHKHVPETQLYSGLTRRPIFVPSVGHFRQGMLVSVPLHLDTLPGKPLAAISTPRQPTPIAAASMSRLSSQRAHGIGSKPSAMTPTAYQISHPTRWHAPVQSNFRDSAGAAS